MGRKIEHVTAARQKQFREAEERQETEIRPPRRGESRARRV
jgi:hypothetical protein